MIILGIDPGTTKIGFGIIENVGGKLTCLNYGLISPSPTSKDVTAKRVVRELNKLINKFKPDMAAVEKLFFFKNKKTIIAVSEMRGVIMASLALKGIPVREFTPLQVKQAVSGYGRAGKDQVQLMVKLILRLRDRVEPDDAADGLAIAICCANNIVYKTK